MLLALSLTLAACEGGTSFTPDYLPNPDGNGGTSSGGSSNAATLIVGTWQTTVITPLPANDFITTQTTWVFKAGGACLQTIDSRQFSEGITHTTSAACTYRLAQGVVLVLYTGAALDTSYSLAFPLNDPNVMILDGLSYNRVL